MSKSAAASLRKPLIGFSLFAIITLFLTYMIWSTLQRSIGGSTGQFSAYFNDASGLAEGDDVRMAGVRVGRVQSVDLDGTRAKVTFDVLDSQRVYDNTRAAIRYQNLIGQRYLALSLQGSTVNGEYRVVPGNQVQPGATLELPGEDSFDVSVLLAGFQPVFDTLEADEVNALSLSLINTFAGDRVALTETISQIGTVAADMADRDEMIGQVISSLSVIMRELAQQDRNVDTLITSVATLIDQLNTNSAAFGTAVTQIGKTAEGFGNVLASSRDDLASAGINAREATSKLIGVGAKLDTMATTLPQFLGYTANVMQQGAYLNIYMCDLDISIGNVLFPPGLINQIGGSNHSVVCR